MALTNTLAAWRTAKGDRGSLAMAPSSPPPQSFLSTPSSQMSLSNVPTSGGSGFGMAGGIFSSLGAAASAFDRPAGQSYDPGPSSYNRSQIQDSFSPKNVVMGGPMEMPQQMIPFNFQMIQPSQMEYMDKLLAMIQQQRLGGLPYGR